MPNRSDDDYDDHDYTAENQSKALARTAGQGGTVARRGFGSEELAVTGETASVILAAQAKAMVEARFIVAMKNPRNWDDVRIKLLKACERTGFATGYLDPGVRDPKKAVGAAWYNKPIGEGVQGFSIRFAEEAMRCMGNLDINTITLYDDEQRRILSVVVTDLENNVALPISITIEKIVERRKLGKNQEFIRTRHNSYGEPLYIVPATEDEVFQKQQSASSKAIRNAILRLLPGDIAAECRQRILEIRAGDVAKDPDKFRKQVTSGFATLNVMPSGINEFLGHELAIATPSEIQDLRDLYEEIKAGKITWVDALDAALEARGEGGQAPEGGEGEGTAEKPANGVAAQNLQKNLRSRRKDKEGEQKQAETVVPQEEAPKPKLGDDQQLESARPSLATDDQGDGQPAQAAGREPGDENDEQTEEEGKRSDILDLVTELSDMKQRSVAAEVFEFYAETRLIRSRSDDDTVKLIPEENLTDVLRRLEGKLTELKKKKK